MSFLLPCMSCPVSCPSPVCLSPELSSLFPELSPDAQRLPLTQNGRLGERLRVGRLTSLSSPVTSQSVTQSYRLCQGLGRVLLVSSLVAPGGSGASGSYVVVACFFVSSPDCLSLLVLSGVMNGEKKSDTTQNVIADFVRDFVARFLAGQPFYFCIVLVLGMGAVRKAVITRAVVLSPTPLPEVLYTQGKYQ